MHKIWTFPLKRGARDQVAAVSKMFLQYLSFIIWTNNEIDLQISVDKSD